MFLNKKYYNLRFQRIQKIPKYHEKVATLSRVKKVKNIFKNKEYKFIYNSKGIKMFLINQTLPSIVKTIEFLINMKIKL